jgi:uncharacterized protein (TIGR02284 family)
MHTEDLIASLAGQPATGDRTLKPSEAFIMEDQKDVVKNAVEVLHDGHKGFMDLAEHIKDPQVKSFFVKEAQTRGEFARQLELAASLPTNESGTTMGALHRGWGDLKAKLGGGDHTLLETAEQGEDAAKEAYEKALNSNEVTENVRQTLQMQQQHILQSHNQVKAFRDSKKAA